jgi:2-polyprenyl-3-methyl-5-hydroxy-6-metoxy-1,4-benzoquinol methylase
MISKINYTAENSVLLQLVPRQAKRVLDVGCGTGALAAAITAQQKSLVFGITYSEDEQQVASAVMQHVWLADLNNFDFSTLGTFDCIICSHVLEHLYDPWDVVRRLKSQLAPGGTLIVALPNVVEIKTRLQILLGRFRYTDWGVLDRTHYRFFDHVTARELLEQAGLRIDFFRAYGYCPLPFIRRFLGSVTARLDEWASMHWPSLIGVQFVFCCSHGHEI